MFECLILGDSIAVGTHQFAPQCAVYAKGGINTRQFNNMYPNKFSARVVVISLGTNDHQHVKTREELQAMRQRVLDAAAVFWVLPAGNLKASNIPIDALQGMVKEVAQQYGDHVLTISGLQKDGIHPSWTGYRRIVEQVKTDSK